jgi:integrase
VKKTATLFNLPTYYSLPTSITVVVNYQNALVQQIANTATTATITPTTATAQQSTVEILTATEPRSVYLRDGEVVMYKVKRSKMWHVRFKLDRHLLGMSKWLRFSTKEKNLELAKVIGLAMYDEARYRQRTGLAPVAKRYIDIAMACIDEMRKDLSIGNGKSVYKDYIQCIERYLIPYFGNRYLTSITHTDIQEFETWRNSVMRKRAKNSTLLTFASAYNRVHQTAVVRGWISERVPVPKLSIKGEKGVTRNAFSTEEIAQMRAYLADWYMLATGKTRQLRRIMRDLVDVLYLTGMRVGTESNALEWQHIEWHTDKGVRYLRIWVNGKTGARWLIAKHELIVTLQRIHSEQLDVAQMTFDELLERRVHRKLFSYDNGRVPTDFTRTFARLVKEMAVNEADGSTNRTLYSIRHTYATEALLAGTDIHTLAKQMGTSVGMLEQHYSKLTATMAAERLA